VPAQDCKDKTTRAEQKGEDSQKRTGIQSSKNRTARTWVEKEWERQNKTTRTELPEQDCQHRTVSKELLK
jgi:hypothetical protein